jgi:benzoyl-CoA reductase/2-hydroxyglutaryl-CoA dehydratase subunit BcrC/BadD/HgdB
MDPIVFEEHSCKENELENTVVYHACAVTLSMKKPLEEQETLLEPYFHQPKYSLIKVQYVLPLKEKCKGFQYLIVLLHSILKDTFDWLMSTITFYIAMAICLVI